MKKYKVSERENEVRLTAYSSEKTKDDHPTICPHCLGKSSPSSSYLSIPLPSLSPISASSSSPASQLPLLRRLYTRTTLHKRLPCTRWCRHYFQRSTAVSTVLGDLVAGVTVALMTVPQAIAYANIAGLPAQTGLYSALGAGLVYAVVGGVRECPVGPTAIAALLTRENNHGLGVQGAVLLAFVTGCVQLLMGLLQLGFLIDFISGPVSIGFTSAIAIVIATTQVKDILGLKFSAEGFLNVWENIFLEIPNTSLYDAGLGLTSIVILLILRKSKDVKIGPKDVKDRKPHHEFAAKTIWFISTTRNIIVVVLSTITVFLYEYNTGMQPFVLTGEVKSGLPDLTLPPFTVHVGNSSYSFIESLSTMGSAVIVVPLVGILENIALAKVFADGKSIDATQEMVALGLCNLAGSFLQAMPVAGALSRGAVSHASGVRTPFAGVYTSLVVLLALLFLTPYFEYIPKAALAAVIIAAVAFMVEFHVLKPIWRTKKSDLIPAIVTFLCCLFFKLEIGIAIGIGINIISLLYASARPSITVDKVTSLSECDYLLVTPDRSLSFPCVEYVRSVVSKAGVKLGASSLPVVIDSRHIQGADFTVANSIKSLIEDFTKREQPILFFNLKASVIKVLQGVQPENLIYCHSYEHLDETLRKYKNISLDNHM